MKGKEILIRHFPHTFAMERKFTRTAQGRVGETQLMEKGSPGKEQKDGNRNLVCDGLGMSENIVNQISL